MLTVKGRRTQDKAQRNNQQNKLKTMSFHRIAVLPHGRRRSAEENRHQVE